VVYSLAFSITPFQSFDKLGNLLVVFNREIMVTLIVLDNCFFDRRAFWAAGILIITFLRLRVLKRRSASSMVPAVS
jgi:hypothetical protein